MTRLRHDCNTVAVLWRRDLWRFWRQPSRIVGALGQPVIFWAIIGGGFASSFRLGEGAEQVGYLSYFYPGVVLMVVLFASIFASVSVLEDRTQGFLQAVLAGPGSRFALVLGKCFGSVSVAAIQVVAFLTLAPLAGFGPAQVAWGQLAAAVTATSLGLSALGFAVAWGLGSTQAYHAVQMTFLVPLWVVSGAMFPPAAEGALAASMRFNPLAYAVAAVRHALYGGQAPAATVIDASQAVCWAVLLGFVACSLSLATWACVRRA